MASEKPDAYDEAWRNEQERERTKGYRGLSHITNRLAADYDDCWKLLQAVAKRCDELERDREADRVRIGELQATVAKMEGFLKQKFGKNGERQTNPSTA